MMRAVVGEAGQSGGMEGAEWGAKLWKEEEGSGTSGNLNSVMSIQAMARCDGGGDTELAPSQSAHPPPCVALCHDEQVHAALLRTVGSAEVRSVGVDHANAHAICTTHLLLSSCAVLCVCVVVAAGESSSVRHPLRWR